MNELKQNFKTEKTTIGNKPCLKITIKGVFTQKYALELCDEWKILFSSDKNKSYQIVINAKEMVDYETIARSYFQKTIKEFKTQIEKMWIVSDSKLITSGAALVRVFTSLSISSVSSEDKIIL